MLDLLSKTELLGCTPMETPMELNVKLEATRIERMEIEGNTKG